MDMKKHDVLSKNLLRSLGNDARNELIQTHISTIILSGAFAYKLKRPVDFGFLDYSTLERRHKFAFEEVRINEVYAPGLYLGVVSITGTIEAPEIDGEGRVLDYAVKMRRFKQDDQLDNIVERGGLAIASMDSVAALIADSHALATRVESDSEYGEPQRVLKPMLENFELLEEMMQSYDIDLDLTSLKAWVFAESERLRPLLMRRKEEGFIRECHGDMHLHNMAMFEGKLVLFDAIEFNPFLNHIDVISDLAFLLMDLEYRGMVPHSHRLLNAYLERTGDYESLGLLAFYKSYRAMVRAKVAALSITKTLPSDERDKKIAEVIGHIVLAKSYTESKKPSLAMTHGFSGSGKSTFALMMVEQHGLIRIRSDVERMRMFERDTSSTIDQGIYTADATRMTYARLTSLARTVIESGFSVIVDATALKVWQRRLFFDLASAIEVPFVIFDLQCDLGLIQARVKKRTQEGDDISQADVNIFRMQVQSDEPLQTDESSSCISIDCSTHDTMQRCLDEWYVRSL